jgi:hypothetical protein
MALSRGEINPLGVLGIRKLSFVPNHFTKVYVDSRVNIKIIDEWINYHLNSRYAIRFYAGSASDSQSKIIEIGIEDPREVTMLSLACPYLHNKT